MNPAQLLEHFDRISEAPDAVTRLRRFILDLAVRGKLVEQDPNDEPAAELLKRIQAEKARLVKEGLSRKEKLLPAVDATELTFDTPPGWINVRLTNLCALENGDRSKNYPSRDEMVPDGIPFINAGHLDKGVVQLADMNFITEERFRILKGGKVREGDILFCLRGSLGKIAMVSGIERGAIASSLVIIRLAGETSTRFMLRYFDSSLAYQMIKRFDNGTAQPNLSSADLGRFVVPLPPLAEQHRIVAKFDELMALCDQLESAKNAREAQRDRLVAASLHRIGTASATEEEAATAAQSATSLRQAARFHLHHLPRLTTRPEHIKQLRQTVLNLAVRGRLVPQDPNDEPAAELLKRIKTHRAKLLNSGYPNEGEARSQLKKQEKQAVPNGLGRIPAGWQWTTLMQCAALIVDCHNKTAPYSQVGIPLIRTTNVRDGKLNLNEPKFVDEPTYARWSARCEPEPGDILITREAPMGEVAVIPDGMKICMGQRMMLIRLIPQTIDSQFMFHSLRDPLLMNRVQDKPVGATVQHLRVGGVETLLIPLPPLAEQHRIVAKVDELMALCDQLETQLTTTQSDSRRLLEAVLHQSVGRVSAA